MSLPEQLFSIAAWPYDLMTSHPAWRAHAADMAAHLPDPRPERPRVVLDLGCGPGVSALAIARRHPADTVIGLDVAPPMIRRAVAHDPGGRCGWLVGSALDLPIRDGAIDAVTGHSFLYLLPDRGRALAEIVRVLRPGGRVALLEPRRQSVREATRSVRQALTALGPHLAFTLGAWRVAARASGAFDDDALRQTLEAAGLHVLTLQRTLLDMGLVVAAEKRA